MILNSKCFQNHGHFDFVTATDKLLYVPDFGLQIMFTRFGANFNLLDLECALLLFCFLLLFGLLVAIATIIHNLANGRVCSG